MRPAFLALHALPVGGFLAPLVHSVHLHRGAVRCRNPASILLPVHLNHGLHGRATPSMLHRLGAPHADSVDSALSLVSYASAACTLAMRTAASALRLIGSMHTIAKLHQTDGAMRRGTTCLTARTRGNWTHKRALSRTRRCRRPRHLRVPHVAHGGARRPIQPSAPSVARPRCNASPVPADLSSTSRSKRFVIPSSKNGLAHDAP